MFSARFLVLVALSTVAVCGQDEDVVQIPALRSDNEGDDFAIGFVDDHDKLSHDKSDPATGVQVEVNPGDYLTNDEWWIYFMCTVLCLMCAAMAAGLTMGFVSLDPFEIDVLLETAEEDCETEEEAKELRREKEHAARVAPILEKQHWLLVTLLLINSLANEALPIFLNQLVPSWLAVILSVTGVLFFGEIIPSAFFTGPHQLAIASSCAPVVRFFMTVLAVVAVPISWILDHFLGEEDKERYNKAELRG